MTEAAFIIAGNSHMFCMGAPYGYDGPIALEPIHVDGHDGFFLMQSWHGDRTPEYWDAAIAHARQHHLIFVVGGNQHFADFVLQPQTLFDVIDPRVPGGPEPGAVLVPQAMVRAFFSPGLANLRLNLARIREAGGLRPLVVSTPPPRSDFTAFADHIRASPFFADVARRRGVELDDIRLTAAPIMLKLWNVTQDLLAEAAAEGGAVYVPVPPSLRDEAGYLAPACHGPAFDFTHANATFGAAMLHEAVVALVASKQRAAPSPMGSSMTDIALHIVFASGGNSDAFIGGGWSWSEPNGRWTAEHSADLQITALDPHHSYRCEMLVGPFVLPPRVSAQHLTILCRGVPLADAELTTGGWVRFGVPREALEPDGSLALSLRLPNAAIPAELGTSADGRRLGVSVAELIFRAAEPDDLVVPSVTARMTQIAAPAVTSGVKPPLAAVTMVYNEPEYLPIWIRHYTRHVGARNCYIIDHGSTDGSTDDVGGCNIIRIPRSPYDPVQQSAFSAKFCSSLLSWYGRVLLSDVDEIMLPDPLVASTLSAYATQNLPEVVNAIGLNLVHRLDHEPDVDLSQPIIAQRPYAFACSPMCKPIMIARDVRWAGGSHSADAVVSFADLYAFHLRWFDRRIGFARMARSRAMAWANERSGGHARVTDAVFDTQLRGFAHLPVTDDVEFSPGRGTLKPFLDEVLQSQVGREFSPYKIDLNIWWPCLWRLPPRFIGTF